MTVVDYTTTKYLFTITPTGNVGIGTTSPLSLSGYTVLSLNNATNGGMIDFQTNGTTAGLIYSYSNSLNIGSNGTNPLIFLTASGTERMRITSGGAIKISAGSPPTSGDGLEMWYNGTNSVIGSIERSTGTNKQLYFFASNTIFENGGSERMRITSGGDVGIGTDTPSSLSGYRYLSINATSGGILDLKRSGTSQLQISAEGSGTYFSGPTSVPMVFTTSNTERMRMTSGGLFKFQNNGSTYESASTGVNEFNTAANDTNVVFRNTAGSLTGARAGIDVFYSAAAPNSTTACFYQAADNAGGRTLRFEVRSNGGIGNYQTNDVNLSDERTKKDIVPLESYWNKFKAIEIVKFKYKDQTHDDFNIGVIAQQVESIAPEFIDADGFGETPKDGVPLKTVYTADLHHATIKVLQECMIKIEEQQKQIEELKLKIK
jgi:hypothetical protein